jgi:hypothetical protein
MRSVVHAMTRPVTRAAVAALTVAMLAITPAMADDDDRDHSTDAASARNLRVSDVGPTSATLSAEITTQGRPTSYSFAYGTSQSFAGHVDGTLAATPGMQTVSVTIQNLQPSTKYFYGLVVRNRRGSDSDIGWPPFTTLAAPAAVAPPAPVAPVATPAPELGRSAVVAPVEGAVKVKVPGSDAYASLAAGASVPVGTVVDTRAGAVQLTSALTGGRTQSAQVGDGLFQVKQSRSGKGVTDLVLRGGDFSVCRSSSGNARAAQARKRPKRRLWARDRGGRFRTKGNNSVATVRGTRWVTTDTCAGTRTTVTEGSVSVRDLRRKRTVIVRKGKSYLARGRR